jgi:hypothetical protein
VGELSNPVQLFLRSGDDFGRTLTWSTSNPAVPVDLTGVSVEFSIRGGSISWQFVNDEHVGVIDAEYGQLFILLSASEVRALRSSGVSVFKFEVTVEFSPQQRRTILFGTLSVSPEAIV